MKRFSFRLETLLTVRRRAEDELGLLLGKKTREIDEARKSLDDLHTTFVRFQDEERKRRTGSLSAAELRYSVVYRFRLRREIMTAHRRLDDLLGQAAELRTKLVRARQRRRSLELMRERKYESWRIDNKRIEQKTTDEVAMRGYIRNLMASDKVTELQSYRVSDYIEYRKK